MPRRFPLLIILILFPLIAAAPPSGGSGGTGGNGDLSRRAVTDRVAEHFNQKQYGEAANLLEKYLARVPHDVPMLYNLACAFARLDRLDDAAAQLYLAVESGFGKPSDIQHLQQDPDLQSLHGHPIYLAIIEAHRRIKTNGYAPLLTAKLALEHWKNQFPDSAYRYEIDPERRLCYAVALDETGWQDMRTMLDAEADHLTRTLFPVTTDYDVLIAVPTPDDADIILKRSNIGGSYLHSKRRLVTRDIGASLRHEFLHLLHYRHMEQLHQPHALWIQEGLASLYENYELLNEKPIRFLPNERHNVAKSRQRSGVLTPWKKLFAMNSDEFIRRGTRVYPEVRSIFEFIADAGKLQSWYRAYTNHFIEDSTGRLAFEKSFDQPLKEIERAWRLWLAQSPARDDRLDYGDASLGVQIDTHGANDGILITHILSGGGAARAQLKRGDVIVAIDNQPIRSSHALAATLAPHQIGDQIQIRIRRDGKYFTRELTLRPLRGGR